MRNSHFHCLLTYFGLLFWVGMVVGCGSKPVAVPESYDQWNSKDGSFALEYPGGWKAEGNGNRSRGVAWAKFTEGNFKIRMDASFGASARADVLFMAGGDEYSTELEPTKSGVIHDHWRPQYEEKYKKYEEQPGETKRLPIGETRVNYFSGKEGRTEVKGIRATTAGLDRVVSFVAHCPKSEFEKFKPVFERCLESLKRGVQQ